MRWRGQIGSREEMAREVEKRLRRSAEVVDLKNCLRMGQLVLGQTRVQARARRSKVRNACRHAHARAAHDHDVLGLARQDEVGYSRHVQGSQAAGWGCGEARFGVATGRAQHVAHATQQIRHHLVRLAAARCRIGFRVGLVSWNRNCWWRSHRLLSWGGRQAGRLDSRVLLVLALLCQHFLASCLGRTSHVRRRCAIPMARHGPTSHWGVAVGNALLRGTRRRDGARPRLYCTDKECK